MPLKQLGPFFDYYVNGYSRSALASAGATTEVIVPFRGIVKEVGFSPVANSATSTMTLQVLVGDNSSAIISAYNSTTPLLTSTNGTFLSATGIIEGQCYSATVNGFVNRGDVLQFTTSGGQDGTMGAQVYAIIRRG